MRQRFASATTLSGMRSNRAPLMKLTTADVVPAANAIFCGAAWVAACAAIRGRDEAATEAAAPLDASLRNSLRVIAGLPNVAYSECLHIDLISAVNGCVSTVAAWPVSWHGCVPAGLADWQTGFADRRGKHR